MKEMSLDDSRRVAISILERFDQTCRKNNLTYFIYYGTLLGAVRHKGFIPWDDDIDVVMPRKDYDDFARIIKDNQEDLLFIRPEEFKDTIYPHGKVVDTRTFMAVPGFKRVNNYGVNIDVFPLDYLSENARIRKNVKKKSLLLKKIIENCARNKCPGAKTITKRIFNIVLYSITRLLDTRKMIEKLNSINISNSVTQYCGISWGEEILVNRLYKAKEYEFEGLLVMGPLDGDYCLKSLYGDYMKLPPEEQRIRKHNSNSYWK